MVVVGMYSIYIYIYIEFNYVLNNIIKYNFVIRDLNDKERH